MFEARFRRAHPVETNTAKGDLMWKTINIPWNICMRALGTVELYQKGANPLTWETPFFAG